MRTRLRGQAAPSEAGRIQRWVPLASLLYPQTLILRMAVVLHRPISPPPPRKWQVYSFDNDAKPVLVFSTQPVLHFPGGKKLELAAKGAKEWDSRPWDAFHRVLQDVKHADFAELLQATLTELMRRTVGSTAEQCARAVPKELRLEPYQLEYFCVRAVQINGNARWRYFVTLPAVEYPVYAVAGRYGHGGLYVLQDRSKEFLCKKGLLAEDQTVHVCAGPRFIKLKDYEKNTTCWPTPYGRHILGDTTIDFDNFFEDDDDVVHPCKDIQFIVPGPSGSHLEGTVWPHSHYAIQDDVEWFADDLLLRPPKAPPKDTEWKLRITKQHPAHISQVVTGDTGELMMTLKFAFQWLPPSLHHLLNSPYHPQSRAHLNIP